MYNNRLYLPILYDYDCFYARRNFIYSQCILYVAQLGAAKNRCCVVYTAYTVLDYTLSHKFALDYAGLRLYVSTYFVLLG